MAASYKGWGKGGTERINASYSASPASNCIGAGRLEGWFTTEAYTADGRGWGHVGSYCFEGDLFFHLQRSPLLRGINFHKKDPVTFEVVEMNGRCEAINVMTSQQTKEYEAGGPSVLDADNGKPDPKELVGQRVEGPVQSQYQLMLKQKWGFVQSESFAGKVFWHITENPEMQEVEFEREDIVEFDVCIDDSRGKGDEVRAKNMRWLRPREKPILAPKKLSEKKLRKKEELMKNWRKGPPPDWDCKACGFHNFGRNKACKKCGQGERPPREEWAPEEDDGEPEHQPMVIPPPLMRGDEPITQPGWFPETWKAGAREPPEEDSRPTWNEAEWKNSRGNKLFQFGSFDGNFDILISAFTDVIENHDPGRTGETILFRMRALMQEVNEMLADRSVKHAFAMQLAKNTWFEHNGYEVRFQPGRNRIGISAKEVGDALEDDGWGPQKRKIVDDWGW